jgi:surfactin synthase thioesterase subunit
MSITQASTSRTVETRDWNLQYYEAGEGHPVILLHGSGPGATGWSNFSGNIEALARQFRVLAVDMPGWGLSDACTVDRLDHVDAVIQFMDALGIEKAAFVGNSMGGADVSASGHRVSGTHQSPRHHGPSRGQDAFVVWSRRRPLRRSEGSHPGLPGCVTGEHAPSG